MNSTLNKINISSFVVKIAARCNINCDYCYVFKHIDQSYKKQPRLLNKTHFTTIAQRFNEYLSSHEVETLRVCLHGGEPLLGGIDYLEKFFIALSQYNENKIRFVIQTNGVLLTKEFLDLFQKYQVGVSLSLDGPPSANDKHRLDYRGRSTYDKVYQALTLLNTEYRELFLGIISVIDPTNDPCEIIDFFAALNPPSYDLLFPDANHLVPPPGRAIKPTIYEEWIKQALHHWYTQHPQLPLRMFMNICDALAGHQTESEFFGNGDISYLIIETDGSYHFSDLLKATYEGASKIGLHVDTSSIEEVLNTSMIQGYQAKLQIENKCDTCLSCPELKICGSGQIAHRYGSNGFNNPTIYCREMLSMIRHARHLMYKGRVDLISREPNRYAEEIVDLFFSDNAIYLMAAIKHREVSGNYDSGLSFNGSKTVQETLKIVQTVFPSLLNEFYLLFPSFQWILPEGCDDPLHGAEFILDQLLKEKLMIFHECYPLFLRSDVPMEALEFAYKLAYSYRFWQHQAAESSDDTIYCKAIEIKHLFVNAMARLELPLSIMGEAFFLALTKEFLPEFHGLTIWATKNAKLERC